VSAAIRAQEFEAGDDRALLLGMRLEPEPSPRDHACGPLVRDGVHARVAGLGSSAALNQALARCQLRHGMGDGAVGVRGTVAFGADGTGEEAELTALASSPDYVDCGERALLDVVDWCDPHERSVGVCTYREAPASR